MTKEKETLKRNISERENKLKIKHCHRVSKCKTIFMAKSISDTVPFS